jgi:membrane-associated phospholipid phosphatase
MRRLGWGVLVLAWAGNAAAGDFARWRAELRQDYQAFYQWRSLGLVALALPPAAALAYSDADAEIRTHYQDKWRSETSDEIADLLRSSGEVTVILPLSLAVAEVATLRKPATDTKGLGGWGRKTFRGMATGVPLTFALQKGLGGARPPQGDSAWDPFEHSATASGHTFVGAIAAFAASDQCESAWARGAWNAASVLTGWSRINDDRHYFSQVVLGWWVAYRVDEAVMLEAPRQLSEPVAWDWMPWAGERGGGVSFHLSW